MASRPVDGAPSSLGRDNLPWLVASVVLVNVVGAAPSVVAGPNSEWFRSLAKPAIYPPGWVFGVVWTGLFTLLGVALYLVWCERGHDAGVRPALTLFAVQIIVNVSWTLAFFGIQRLDLGLGVIVLLWVLVAPTAVLFWRVRRAAGLLLVPYLAWITFAAVLNYRFLVLN